MDCCKKLLIFVVLACCAAAALCVSMAGDDKSKVQVLIVTGIDHPAHDWRQTAPALAQILAADGRIEVRVVEDPHFLDSPALHRYAAVILHFMNWEQPAPGPAARANLREFVRGGKGLFIVHFACGAFQEWPEFESLAGRVWDPNARPHDPKGVFRVEIVDSNHPVTRGLKSFETDDELYTCLAGRREIKVLATARSKVDAKDYPVAFVLNYGRGRVFHCSLGHDVKALRNPNVAELFRRVCAWTTGLPVRQQTQRRTQNTEGRPSADLR